MVTVASFATTVGMEMQIVQHVASIFALTVTTSGFHVESVVATKLSACSKPECQEHVRKCDAATCRFVTIVLLNHAKAAIRVSARIMIRLLSAKSVQYVTAVTVSRSNGA